jgi:hypothetical protein
LQRLVSRLRKVLPEGLVEGQTDGYRLRVEPDAVDAVRFERLVGQARNDEDPRRVRLLREALALWRGAAMQGVGLPDSEAFDAAVTFGADQTDVAVRIEGSGVITVCLSLRAHARFPRNGRLPSAE